MKVLCPAFLNKKYISPKKYHPATKINYSNIWFLNLFLATKLYSNDTAYNCIHFEELVIALKKYNPPPRKNITLPFIWFLKVSLDSKSSLLLMLIDNFKELVILSVRTHTHTHTHIYIHRVFIPR